jgi:hypothetical protein
MYQILRVDPSPARSHVEVHQLAHGPLHEVSDRSPCAASALQLTIAFASPNLTTYQDAMRQNNFTLPRNRLSANGCS